MHERYSRSIKSKVLDFISHCLIEDLFHNKRIMILGRDEPEWWLVQERSLVIRYLCLLTGVQKWTTPKVFGSIESSRLVKSKASVQLARPLNRSYSSIKVHSQVSVKTLNTEEIKLNSMIQNLKPNWLWIQSSITIKSQSLSNICQITLCCATDLCSSKNVKNTAK